MIAVDLQFRFLPLLQSHYFRVLYQAGYLTGRRVERLGHSSILSSHICNCFTIKLSSPLAKSLYSSPSYCTCQVSADVTSTVIYRRERKPDAVKAGTKICRRRRNDDCKIGLPHHLSPLSTHSTTHQTVHVIIVISLHLPHRRFRVF